MVHLLGGLCLRAWAEIDGPYLHGTLPPGRGPGEVADHEEQVHQPECEPRRPDDKKPNRKEDQARTEEQQGVTEQPETIASPGVVSPLSIIDPAAHGGAVVIERREHE